MRKYAMLAASNIRKRKKQTIVIITLIIAAACMMNIWLILAGDYKNNFDTQHDRLHSEHVTMAISSNDSKMREFLDTALKEDPDISEYRMDDGLLTFGTFQYNGGSISTNLMFMDEKTAFSRSIGKSELIEKKQGVEGIYLPILYANDEKLKLGNDFEVIIGDQVLTFPIAGYTNHIMNGSHNCMVMILALDSELYQDIKDKQLPKSTFVSVRLHDKQDGEIVETRLSELFSEQYPNLQMISGSYQLVSSSRYISQMIAAAILSAMAFIVLLIVMIVIIANVITDIQENMKKLGILKAIGYQSRQIILAYMFQMMLLSVLSSAFGALLTYSLFPSVNEMMISQTGIPYHMRFLPLPFLITIAFITSIVVIAVYLSVHRIKRYEAIRALRQGIPIHNFRKNHVPLSNSRMPLLPCLSLKTATVQAKQNIIVCIMTVMLTLVSAFTAVMLKNVILDITPMIDMVAGETADSSISIDTETEAELKDYFQQDPRVEKSYLFHSGSLRHVNGVSLVVTITDGFNDLNNQMVCVEGRLPRYKNETAVAIKYAKDQGIKIGDEITFSTDGKEASYIVSGYSQIANNLGKDCFLTRQGYERMGKLAEASYYLNLKPGTDIDAFNEDVRNTFHEHVKASVNIDTVIDATSGVYVALMSFIVVAIVLLGSLIVLLVLYLLVRTLLNQKQYEYGIMKALGFTTGQLVLQTALSFMPVVICSCVIGLIINSYLINPLASLFLSNVGIVKCMFEIPVGLIIVFGVGLIIFTFVIICIMSLRIKRITPKALLSGE